jgi:hypothetical protein
MPISFLQCQEGSGCRLYLANKARHGVRSLLV